MDKEDILAEIRRTADKNGGVPLGGGRFYKETGIKTSDWWGKFWAKWGDALVEAGFSPNKMRCRRSDEDILGELSLLVQELGHLPSQGELRLKLCAKPGFPTYNTITKHFGNKQSLATRLSAFCKERGQENVVAICDAEVSSAAATLAASAREGLSVIGSSGYVYLIKHGGHCEYKIGRTSNALRREGEIAASLPQQVKPIHVIETDDPVGLEAYWHRRFADRRIKNEWFELTAEDVKAFKRWRKIF